MKIRGALSRQAPSISPHTAVMTKILILVMALFTNTHSRPSKHPAETRHKLIEVDNATKRWCEIMGEDVPEAMLRTAYVGILDPITRTHLTNFQGRGTKPETLKQEILRFVSNAVVDHNAMNIGSFEDDGGSGAPDGGVGAYPESEHTIEEWSYHEEVNAIGNNGGYWQFTGKSGPWKGKGKGKKKKNKRKRRKRERRLRKVAQGTTS